MDKFFFRHQRRYQISIYKSCNFANKKSVHDKGKSSRMADNSNGTETTETIFTPGLKLNDGFVPSDESSELVKPF